jgi:hypothetical protein
MNNQKNKTTEKSMGIKILCVAIAVLFLAFSVYEIIRISSSDSHAFDNFPSVMSTILILIYGFGIVAVGVVGFIAQKEIARKTIILMLTILALVFEAITIAITVSYIVSGFLFGDALTIAVNLAMIIALVLFIMKKKIGLYLLALPAATLVLHFYNMIWVYPNTSSSVTSYYIWSIFMVAFAVLVAVYLINRNRVFLLLGMGVFAFTCFFRMLLTIGSDAGALLVLTSFVQLFADILFLVCIAFLLVKSEQTKNSK